MLRCFGGLLTLWMIAGCAHGGPAPAPNSQRPPPDETARHALEAAVLAHQTDIVGCFETAKATSLPAEGFTFGLEAVPGLQEDPPRDLQGCIEAHAKAWPLDVPRTNPQIAVWFLVLPTAGVPARYAAVAAYAHELARKDASVLLMSVGWMTAPRRVSGPEPQDLPRVKQTAPEVRLDIRCRMTVSGEVQECQVVRGPDMGSEELLKALETLKYEPVRWNGDAVEVPYTMHLESRRPR